MPTDGTQYIDPTIKYYTIAARTTKTPVVQLTGGVL
jgi:hypothetical protein